MHTLRVIDLLYKKFVIYPEKNQNDQNLIYKSEAVYGENYYYLPEIKNKNKETNIQLKRSSPGLIYPEYQHCLN